MNIDLAATTSFNDPDGFRNFLLVHRFVHDHVAAALTTKFQVPCSTFGLGGERTSEAILELMKNGKAGQRMPDAVKDWLKLHSDMHAQNYSLLGQSATTSPDLTQVDFGSAEQYYDWMYVHQQLHDFEFAQLGLT